MPVIHRKFSRDNGFTLIEVLVAAIVLAIGILGMATMMLTSLKSEQSALYRSLASSYAYDMADRIRKNRAWAIANNKYDAINTSNAVPSDPACWTSAAGCSETQRADLDIREWASNFANVYSLANFSAPLPNAAGTVTRGDGNLFTITISWNEVDWDENNLNQRVASNESLSLNILL
jgi:type IV pilus assembly protein PilV